MFVLGGGGEGGLHRGPGEYPCLLLCYYRTLMGAVWCDGV
jgi:hypothetical protein